MIIGIMANAGSGKDTAADYLVKNYGFVKMSLADELKRICKRVYDFSDEQLWGPSEMRNKTDERYPRTRIVTPQGKWEDVVRVETTYLSPRVALQTLGTEWGREMYQNTWVDLTLRDAKKVLQGGYRYSQQEGVQRAMEIGADWPDNEFGYNGVVIPDCRFRNELDAVHGAGGKVIRLVRKGASGDVGLKGHASEVEQNSIPDSDLDYVIHVAEGIPNFHKQLADMMLELR